MIHIKRLVDIYSGKNINSQVEKSSKCVQITSNIAFSMKTTVKLKENGVFQIPKVVKVEVSSYYITETT